jgi:hypothetical protein
MKNKILYGFLIFYFLLFFACKDNNIDRSQQTKIPIKEILNDTPQYIVIGKPFRPIESQIAAKKYGFQFDYLGCIMTDENEKLQKEQNSKTEKILKAKFGNNFWDKFDKDLDSIVKIQYKLDSITELVSSQKIVKNKVYEIENSSNFKKTFSYVPSLKDTSRNTYLVEVIETDGQNKRVYFRYFVNANTMTIIDSKN